MMSNNSSFASVVVAIWLSLFSTACVAQESGSNRKWQFQAEKGSVELLLRDVAGTGGAKAQILEIWYSESSTLSLAQETQFVKTVLTEVAASSKDSHSLNILAIEARGFSEREIRKKIVERALKSTAWRRLATQPGGAEKVVADLLNRDNPYRAFDAVLRPYGLQVDKINGVEKVSVERCRNLISEVSLCRSFPATLVPTGANFRLELKRSK